ncbi:hypothetical protein [uncultured Sphingomonas sp.]|uniref:hypothetical protein n=1 Tax=uncultured Sphingomonas sp. TaxID=158754 RepID=UPI0035CA095A
MIREQPGLRLGLIEEDRSVGGAIDAVGLQLAEHRGDDDRHSDASCPPAVRAALERVHHFTGLDLLLAAIHEELQRSTVMSTVMSTVISGPSVVRDE